MIAAKRFVALIVTAPPLRPCSLSVKAESAYCLTHEGRRRHRRSGPAGRFAGIRRPLRCGTKLITEAQLALGGGRQVRRTRRSDHAAQRLPPPGHLGPAAARSSSARSYIEVPVESWIYNLGPNKLMRQVIFEARRRGRDRDPRLRLHQVASQLRALRGDPAIDLARQHVHRHGAVAQHLAVELAHVESRRRARPAPWRATRVMCSWPSL